MKKKNKQPKTKDKLHNLVLEINQNHGKNTIRFAKDEPVKKRLPFGVKEIDDFIGGGIVEGMFTIIYGSESVGKSTLAYTQIATLQKMGKICVLIDMEHSYDNEYAKLLGIDTDNLIILTADTAEEVLDIVIKLSKSKAINYIVLDSLQSLAPVEEMKSKKGKELSIADDQMAVFAKKIGKFLRDSSPFIYKAKMGFLFIGQTRMKGLGTFFAKEGLSGGNAIHHWASLILHMRKGMKANSPTAKINGKKTIIGFPSVIKIEKTKVFGSKPENSEIQLPFYYGRGFFKEEDKNV